MRRVVAMNETLPEAQADALYCPHCGYDLRTLATSACPECGGAVDVEELKKSQIPWTYRGEIGFLRAFWRTAWQVTVKTKRFSQEVCRPVELREALRFRRWMVVWLSISIVLPLIVLLAAFFVVASWFDAAGLWSGLGLLGLSLIFVLALLVPYFFLWTGVHTYWFHPRHLSIEQQNRAVALSYYACGPLAFFPVFFWVAYGVICVLEEFSGLVHSEAIHAFLLVLGLLVATPTAAIPVAFWLVCWSMVGRAAKRGRVGQAMLVVGLPLAWAALAGLILMVIPVSLAYVVLVLYTLWW